jgi:hypothetical protein
LIYLKKYPGSLHPLVYLQQLTCMLLSVLLLVPASAVCKELDWSIGGYAGKYYDTEPAGFSQGKANYLDQYIVAITASKTVWRAESWPLALEIDGMMGYQFGLASLQEIAIAPVVRWNGFPWNEILQTGFRFGPVGASYTSAVSPIERGPSGDGSHILNFLLIELDFSLPEIKSNEVFFRLHHRCSLYDLLNNYPKKRS